MTETNVNIYIIEDEVIIAHDIANKVKKLNYHVMGTAHNSDDAISYLSFHTPDLILCDIHIKGTKDGIDVMNIISAKKKIPFIYLTALSDKTTLDRAKTTLPYGYIVKPFTAQDLITNIEMALYKFEVEIQKQHLTLEGINSIAFSPLTNKEFEFLNELASGLNNHQLAERFFISVNTVKFHLKNIFTKLAVNSRTEAIHKVIALISKS